MVQHRRIEIDSIDFSEAGLLSQDETSDIKTPYRWPVKAENVPLWMQYPYVLDNYRLGGTYKECFRSLFSLHTETVNAWTMILNSVLSVSTTILICAVHNLQGWEAFAFVACTLSALVHLPFSLGYHLFMPINSKVANLWRRLDVCTIFVCSVFVAFSLDYFVLPLWGTALNTSITVLVAVWAVIVFWRTPDNKPLDKWKHTLFILCIISCYLYPMFHAVIRDAIHGDWTMSTTALAILMASFFFGVWAYTTSWPERLAPGKFDIFGHSHAIMHAALIIAHQMKLLFLLEQCTRHKQLK